MPRDSDRPSGAPSDRPGATRNDPASTRSSRLCRARRPLRRAARRRRRGCGRTGGASPATRRRLGADALGAAEAAVARQLHENGVTYNVYADAGGPARPWALDVLPHVVPAASGSRSPRGLRQRARLLNALAADLYGPQRLLAEGLIPPALVLGHPGFLRAVSRRRGAGRRATSIRSPSIWRAARRPMVGRRHAHAGAVGRGLRAREPPHRLAALPRRLPRAARARLAPFFLALQETLLASRAVRRRDAAHRAARRRARTTRPTSSTRTSPAISASPLVEGGDLTVRDDRVYLKTLTGLGAFTPSCAGWTTTSAIRSSCAPTRRSACPGLVQALARRPCARRQRVRRGVLESPALLGIPAGGRGTPARRALDAAVRSPRGGAARRPRSTRRGAALPQMVIKPAFPDVRMEPVFAAISTRAGPRRLDRRLAEAPERYVLEEYLPLSHAPVWHGGRLESRALMLRVFLVADGRGDYRVMPGGLSRIAGERAPHRLGPARREQQGHVGALGFADRAASRSCPDSSGPRTSRSPSAWCRAAPARICSGSGATPSAARTARACCAPCCRGCPTATLSARSVARASIRTCAGTDCCRPPGRAAQRARRTGVRAADLDHRHARSQGSAIRSLAFNLEQTARVAGAVRDRLSVGQLAAGEPSSSQAFAQAEQPAGLAGALDADRSGHRVAGRRRRPRDGAHDPRRRLALPEPRAPPRAAALRRDDGRRGRSRRGARTRPRSNGCSTCPTASSRIAPATAPARVAGGRGLLLFDRRNPRSAAFQLAKLAKHVRLLPEADLAELVGELGRGAGVCQRRRAPRRRGLLLAARRARGLPPPLRAPGAAPVGRADAALLQPRLRDRRRPRRRSEPRPTMTARYRIEHDTRYAYAARVSTSQHVAYLGPRALPRQRVAPARRSRSSRTRARVDAAHRLLRQRGRPVHAAQPARELAVARTAWSRSCPRGRHRARAEPAVGRRAPIACAYRQAASPAARPSQYAFASPYVALDPELAEFARSSFHAGPAAARRGRRPDAPHPRGVPLRSVGDDDHDAGRRASSPSGAASARTSRISRSRACARSGWPPAT